MDKFDQFVEEQPQQAAQVYVQSEQVGNPSLVAQVNPELSKYTPRQGFDLADLIQPKGHPSTEQSEESRSIIERHLADKPQSCADTPFFNARRGAYILQEEKPRHRLMCLLSAEGFDNTEIAKQLDYTTAHVNYVLKQPWALSFISKLLAEKGGNAVQEVLQGAAMKAAEHLAKTIDNSQAPASVRAKCANDILDRVFGKAQQIVLHGKADPSEMTDEELATLASQKTN